MNSGRALLECHALKKSFGKTDALCGVDFAIEPGEVVAVHGASGSGKSTLLFCLAGILRPDDGVVLYNGQRIDDQPDRVRTQLRRRELGFVFQFGQLVPELTARENIEMPLLLNKVSRAEARAHADEWLEQVGIADVADLAAGEMSGGQAQLVAVARALVHRPRVLFADEPTGALHSAAGDRVMELLVDAARVHSTAVVLVTHDARVAAYAQREVMLRDGVLSQTAAAL